MRLWVGPRKEHIFSPRETSLFISSKLHLYVIQYRCRHTLADEEVWDLGPRLSGVKGLGVGSSELPVSTNPHGWTKSTNLRYQIHPDRPYVFSGLQKSNSGYKPHSQSKKATFGEIEKRSRTDELVLL